MSEEKMKCENCGIEDAEWAVLDHSEDPLKLLCDKCLNRYLEAQADVLEYYMISDAPEILEAVKERLKQERKKMSVLRKQLIQKQKGETGNE